MRPIANILFIDENKITTPELITKLHYQILLNDLDYLIYLIWNCQQIIELDQNTFANF